MTHSKYCTTCGAEIRATSKFCQRCGTPTDGRARTPAGGPLLTKPQTVLPWIVAGIALLSLLAFIGGQNFRRSPSAAPSAIATTGAPTQGRAPDISQMSPEERADRLFQRVMEYVTAGKSDSVQFFAPMAIQSQLALAPLDAHRRYDVGLLGLISGDPAMGRAQADTILAANSDHLLGLILAMRTAAMQRDTVARDRFAGQLQRVIDRERAKQRPEYVDHDPDITAGLREAANPSAPAIR